MISLESAFAGLAATASLMFVAWLLSVPLRDVSIVDVFWSGNLAAHIFWRNRGEPEDRRCRAMREKRDPGFWWKSLFVVFLLQAVLAWIISLPILGAVAGGPGLGWLDVFGLLLWVFGFGFEAVADWQLTRFLANPGRGDAVMDRGLWRYSRHPNYFGECCLWWGIYLLAVAAGAWWTVVGPAVLTAFLLRVSGVALTERDIARRRPAYEKYVRCTSAFVPMPRRDA